MHFEIKINKQCISISDFAYFYWPKGNKIPFVKRKDKISCFIGTRWYKKSQLKLLNIVRKLNSIKIKQYHSVNKILEPFILKCKIMIQYHCEKMLQQQMGSYQKYFYINAQ